YSCRSHSAHAHDFSSHQFPEVKNGPRRSMILPRTSALRTCMGQSSSNRTDADPLGRKRRSARHNVWRVKTTRDLGCALGVAELLLPFPAVEVQFHTKASIRNASGRCVSSNTG